MDNDTMKTESGVYDNMKEELAISIFRPEGSLKAAVFVVHGMEEHHLRYNEFAEYLKENGIGVVTYDLPGHGKSGPIEDRGWFGDRNGWSNLVESAVEIAQLARKEFPNVPLFCFAHSMGTMIARTFIQLHDGMIDGLILSGAPNYVSAASLGKTIASAVCRMKGNRGKSKLLDSLATGGFSKAVKDAKTPVDWLSVNEENVQKYIDDPDCGWPFTARGYYDLFDGMIRMHDVTKFRCLNPLLPIWLFAGEGDPCIGGEKGFADSIETLRRAGYTNVTSTVYPGMRHETLNETDHMKVFEDVAEWILGHC